MLITELMLELAVALAEHGDKPVMARRLHQIYGLPRDTMAVARDTAGTVKHVSFAIDVLPMALSEPSKGAKE